MAFIYGSYAKGRENYLSDIDVFIVGSPNEDLLIKELDRLEETIKREVNFRLYAEGEFKNKIAAGDPFLNNLIREKKPWLIGDEDELRKIVEE